MILDATYGLAARDLVEELRALAEWATFAAALTDRELRPMRGRAAPRAALRSAGSDG